MTLLNKKINSKKQCNNASIASKFLHKMILDNDREHFCTLTLDANNKPISSNIISIGTANASLVHPREVFKQAIKEGACYIITGHNHPSGNLDPSDADKQVAKRMQDAGVLLGIEVIDNIVMDKKGNYKRY